MWYNTVKTFTEVSKLVLNRLKGGPLALQLYKIKLVLVIHSDLRAVWYQIFVYNCAPYFCRGHEVLLYDVFELTQFIIQEEL